MTPNRVPGNQRPCPPRISRDQRPYPPRSSRVTAAREQRPWTAGRGIRGTRGRSGLSGVLRVFRGRCGLVFPRVPHIPRPMLARCLRVPAYSAADAACVPRVPRCDLVFFPRVPRVPRPDVAWCFAYSAFPRPTPVSPSASSACSAAGISRALGERVVRRSAAEAWCQQASACSARSAVRCSAWCGPASSVWSPLWPVRVFRVFRGLLTWCLRVFRVFRGRCSRCSVCSACSAPCSPRVPCIPRGSAADVAWCLRLFGVFRGGCSPSCLPRIGVFRGRCWPGVPPIPRASRPMWPGASAYSACSAADVGLVSPRIRRVPAADVDLVSPRIPRVPAADR